MYLVPPITAPFPPTNLVILPEGILDCLPYSYHGDTSPEMAEIVTSTSAVPPHCYGLRRQGLRANVKGNKLQVSESPSSQAVVTQVLTAV